MDPVPATLGDFRISALLGQGGSGIVYDATWGPRRVALKVLHPALVGTGKERAQYVTEAQRLQAITHPSVVKVFAVGELPDGRPYLAMERLDGETLAKVLERGPLPLALALEMFGELAGAVATLHEQSLVHRDLKPENVFVVGLRHAVLLDFGIAKDLAASASTTTQDGHVRGTPAYMAPERFFGQSAGIATDVYELALVLYAMLAGRLPWDDLADPEARLAPRSLLELADVPEALDVEIRRALSTRAQNRPASARALLAAVQEAASKSAVAAEPAVTARLRPDAAQPRPPGDRAPTPEQPTPLAWAPTLPAPARAKGSQRRWWLAGTATLALAGGTIWFVATRHPHDAPPPGVTHPPGPTTAVIPVPPPLKDDPWGTAAATHESPQEAKALALVEPKLSIETYRAEAAAAVARLPPDTRFVFTAEVGELRAQPQLADMLAKIPKDPRVKLMTGMVPPCVRAIAADSEWIAFGAPALHDSLGGTLVMRGRWQRADVEACLGETAEKHVVEQGTLYRLGDDGWLDFVDDHTAYVTMRHDLSAEAVHALVRHGAGPQQHARDLFAKLPADRSISIVLDGHADDDLTDTLSLPKGSDLFGWVRAEPGGVTLDMAADPHDARAAKAAVDKLQPQLEKLWGTSDPKAVGRIEIVAPKSVVHVRGNVTALMLGIVSASL